MRRTVFDAQRIVAAAVLRLANRALIEREVKNVTNVVGVAALDDKMLALFYRVPNLFVDHEVVRDLFRFEIEIEDVVTGDILPAARPAQGGESVGSQSGETGTLGCLVEDATGTRFILSCNHVLADTNKGQRHGTQAWQPGKKDGGNAQTRIGLLHEYSPIVMGGNTPNDIDAALAVPDSNGSVTNKIKGIGTLNGYDATPRPGTVVKKSGYYTNVTSGRLTFSRASHQVPYGNDVALFENQYGILGSVTGKVFAEQGDSGAIVVDEQKRAIGLVFAVAAAHDLTFANPIEPVLDYFGVDLA